MLNLSLKRYSFILFFQFLLIFLDLSINSFSFLARGNKIKIVFIYLAQDISLILCFTTLIFNLYSTFVYQTGLANLLLKKFRTSFIILTIYFILCVSQHVWIIMNYNKFPYFHQWPKSLVALFIIQRLFSPIHYYFYKRCALRISDPRFYENLDWVTEQLAIK